MSFKGGVGSFIAHLQSVLQADWRLGSAVTGIRADGNSYRIVTANGEELVDEVVLAATAPATAEMLRDLDAELAARLAGIEYSPIAVVGFGYRHPEHPMDGFGLLGTIEAEEDACAARGRRPQHCTQSQMDVSQRRRFGPRRIARQSEIRGGGLGRSGDSRSGS